VIFNLHHEVKPVRRDKHLLVQRPRMHFADGEKPFGSSFSANANCTPFRFTVGAGSSRL